MEETYQSNESLHATKLFVTIAGYFFTQKLSPIVKKNRAGNRSASFVVYIGNEYQMH